MRSSNANESAAALKRRGRDVLHRARASKAGSTPRSSGLTRGAAIHRLFGVAALALALGEPAQALQILEASDGVAVEGVISIKEPTRIRIEGAAITDVVGNIYASHCGAPPPGATTAFVPLPPGVSPSTIPLNPAGEVVLECDKDKGEVYVRPVGVGDKPINLFVSSAAATYTLVLRRADTPADTLLIRDKTLRRLRRAIGDATPATSVGPTAPAPSHVRAMKALLVAMASDRVPPDLRVEETLRPVKLWSETSFSLLRTYEGRCLIGELYLLENLGPRQLDLAEQQFDRPNGALTTEVAGVAIDRLTLGPGETTRVYVIRRGGAR